METKVGPGSSENPVGQGLDFDFDLFIITRVTKTSISILESKKSGCLQAVCRL